MSIRIPTRRTLQLPLVRESEVQTEEVPRFDVYSQTDALETINFGTRATINEVQDMEVQTEVQSAIDLTSSHPENFPRKRKWSIMSNSSQMNSDWLTVTPRPSPFRFGSPRINGYHGKQLLSRKSEKNPPSRDSDPILMTFDGADIKSILNNPTKFIEMSGFSGIGTGYFKVHIY